MSSTLSTHRPGAAPIATMGGIFFILGFVTWMNGPLITFVKLAFQLDDVGAFLVPTAFYLSYFFFSLPAAWLMRLTGLKRGMSCGLIVMGAGTALLGQCATMRYYPGALAGLFVIGSGLSLLQTAVNPYVSILGPIETAARRIAIMGVCNKLAGILAPLAIGALVLRNMDGLAAQVKAAPDAATRSALLDGFAMRVHWPYLAMALVLALLGVFALRSRLPEIDPQAANRPESGPVATTRQGGMAGLGSPHLWLGVLCLFLYVGVEVMAGDAIGTYGQAFGLPLDLTKFFTAFTLAAMLLGYLVGMLVIPRVVSQQRYLALSAGLGILLTVGAFLTTGLTSVLCVAALGFANAMMWPAIFPLAIAGLGRATGLGSALLVMGICGGAVVPQLFVAFKQHHDMQTVFTALMGPSYAYILFYALRGHALRRP